MICIGWSFVSNAKTIIVRPNNPKATLALSFERAKEGDTLLIQPGIYREGALFLKKKVTLIGIDFPVIDGENKYENLLVEHDGVIIKGLVFKNSGSSSFNDIAALKIQNSKNVIVQNCRFINNFFAIHTMNSQRVKYLNNYLKSGQTKGKPAANGIHCWKSKYLTIRGNTIDSHRDGIYLEFVNHSLIENNKSLNNKRYGMHFMFSHDNRFQHNTFDKNAAGVAVMYSKRVLMTDNTFAESWGGAAYGILLKEIDDSKVIGNHFRENTMAIYADGANRIVVQNNDFIKNGWAIKINASSIDATITNNNFIANTFDMATNGNLVVKALNNNYWDKYEGYDLNRDGIGDVPYRPITFYSIIIEKNPGALMLFRSFFVKLMDKAENVYPLVTPENIKDEAPRIRKLNRK